MYNVKLSDGNYVNLDAIPYVQVVSEDEIRLTMGVDMYGSNRWMSVHGEDAKEIIRHIESFIG